MHQEASWARGRGTLPVRPWKQTGDRIRSTRRSAALEFLFLRMASALMHSVTRAAAFGFVEDLEPSTRKSEIPKPPGHCFEGWSQPEKKKGLLGAPEESGDQGPMSCCSSRSDPALALALHHLPSQVCPRPSPLNAYQLLLACLCPSVRQGTVWALSQLLMSPLLWGKRVECG